MCSTNFVYCVLVKLRPSVSVLLTKREPVRYFLKRPFAKFETNSELIERKRQIVDSAVHLDAELRQAISPAKIQASR